MQKKKKSWRRIWVTHPYIRYGNLKHSKTVSMIKCENLKHYDCLSHKPCILCTSIT
jgi:hypothetical protein